MKVKREKPLAPTKMAMPKNDERDPQFHLDITKKNTSTPMC